MNKNSTGSRFYDKINQSSFNNFNGNNFTDGVQMDGYDPSYSYDPNYADSPTGGAGTRTEQSRPGQKMQINLTLSNPTAVKQKIELFSAFFSWAFVKKTEYATGAFTVIPQLSTEGLATVGAGTVGYDQDGNCRKYGVLAAANVSIGCGEYPYLSLVESTKVLPFKCTFMRIAVETQAQLNNQIIHFTRTFGGGLKQNQINVRAYKSPYQQQNLEVDTKAPFDIDGEKGLVYDLEIGEVVQLGMFINRWTRPSI